MPRRLCHPVALVIAVAILAIPALVHVERAVAVPNTWSPAGNMTTARAGHTATLLPSGKVLVTGGSASGLGSILRTAELYDPVGNVWSPAASMAFSRTLQTATLLPSGKVLVVGGLNGGTPGNLATAEIYDPDLDTWSPAASMSDARYSHTATLLTDGRVLVVGGNGVFSFLASAEIYDPVANTWSAAGSLATARSRHTATLLPNGNVLTAGGDGGAGHLASAELYNAVGNTWSAAGSMIVARVGHAATLLPNGRVLVVGSSAGPSSAELYDVASDAWSAAGSLVSNNASPLVLLGNGRVLVEGGCGVSGCSTLLSSAELYDPATETWTLTASLATARFAHTATLLSNGKVVVAGGAGFSTLASAEIYEPGRDHKTDANGDGYSAADETTLANCGAVSCASIITFGTAEIRTCKDAGRNCGSPGPPADESAPARIAPPPALGYGCAVALDIVPPKTTKALAQSDVDLDGSVTILDLSKVASWFGNTIDASPADPRWEGDMDGDGHISILDLSAIASNFGRSVAGDCKIE